MNSQSLVGKVWNFAHVLRDQGVSYQAYISQISYLLFLKMDEERVTQIGEASMLPAGFRWGDIKDMTGEPLAVAYGKLLEKLSRQGGIIGTIFLKAQNEIQDPAKLSRLVGLIDSETWLGLPVDVKGAIYEGLLARNAEDVKSGAGQYFTPRALIEAMVEVVDPDPTQTVHDPACGTAGFLLSAWAHMKNNPRARDKAVYSALKNKFSGVEIVPEADQSALHPEGAADDIGRSSRFRRPLSLESTVRTSGDRALQEVPLGDAALPRQSEPRYLLAERRRAGRSRLVTPARRGRRGDRREFGNRVGAFPQRGQGSRRGALGVSSDS
jgi:hypothetical protein